MLYPAPDAVAELGVILHFAVMSRNGMPWGDATLHAEEFLATIRPILPPTH